MSGWFGSRRSAPGQSNLDAGQGREPGTAGEEAKRVDSDMGTFNYDVGLGRLAGGPLTPIRARVDTGSIHSMFPSSLLAQLNISPIRQRSYALADGSRRQYGFGYANIEVDGLALPCPVIFGPEDKHLLGATTLEAFELMVDPVAGRLVPRELYTGPI